MTSLPVQMMDEPGEQAGSYTADRQVGKKGNCYVAQVFGPNGDSVLTVDPTDDPAEASRIAAVCAAALSAPVAPVPEPTPQQATPAAWINYKVIQQGGEVVGYEPPELHFKRLSYGYDWTKSEPLFRVAPVDTKPAERQPLTALDITRAARALSSVMDYPWEHMPNKGRDLMRANAKLIIDAALQAKPAESGT